MKRRNHAATGGITFLELLAALAVAAVLCALLYPVARSAYFHSLRVESANHLRQLVEANLSYAADHGRYAPAMDQKNLRRWHGTRPNTRSPFDPAQGFLSPYLGQSRRVTPCPMLRRMLPKEGLTFEDGSGGYGYNSVYLGGMRDSVRDAAGIYVSLPALRAQRPSQTLMFASTAYANGATLQEYPFCEPPFWDFGFGIANYRPSPSLHFRFNGKALVAWCDGHLTLEAREDRPVGTNPHGGDATAQNLGWFGPDADNGYWNPARP